MSTRSDAWEAKLPAETAKELYRLTKCPTEEEAKAWCTAVFPTGG